MVDIVMGCWLLGGACCTRAWQSSAQPSCCRQPQNVGERAAATAGQVEAQLRQQLAAVQDTMRGVHSSFATARQDLQGQHQVGRAAACRCRAAAAVELHRSRPEIVQPMKTHSHRASAEKRARVQAEAEAAPAV